MLTSIMKLMGEITFLSLVSASLKSKVQMNKMKTVGQAIDYRCLIHATYGNKTISNSVVTGLLIAEVNVNTMSKLCSGGVSLVSMAMRIVGNVGVQIVCDPAQSKTAFVTFKDAKALEIALLLSICTQIALLSLGIEVSVPSNSILFITMFMSLLFTYLIF
ncbi:putative signal recognition particle, SRP14 subunit [Rosa chinensis]|uniref:Putative signal recognition particle, SRP14 subunit n=1 Tax=Rosa chinensis TaxID=74649 RepID=A0A2P6PAI0_ROSCH|nr:putative signal recognition particle, SRP14 subunit [Rosa chinensis]